MMWSSLFGIAGVTLDIAGATVLAWGLFIDEDEAMKLGGSYIAGERESRLRTPPVQDRLRQARNARIGLGLLICGFILQMVSYIMNTPTKRIEITALDVGKTVDLLTALAGALGIAGAALLFYFAPPDPDAEPGALVVENANVDPDSGKTYGELRKERRDRWRRYVRWSRVGFAIVVAGFVVQIGASVMHALMR